MHLQRTDEKSYFWLGTGGHFAMEDFYGYKRYKTASDAFRAYAIATKKDPNSVFPVEGVDLTTQATAMLDYYENYWSLNRPHHETYWYNDVPQVEVDFEIPLDVELSPLARTMVDLVVYRGTFDRVIEEASGRLFIYEYKFPKNFELFHSDTDEQVSSYCWAGSFLYPKPIEGVYYQQHKKSVPQPARILSTGKISTNKDQLTTRALYREALINLYGSVEKAPYDNIECLNHLASLETEVGDKYVNRQIIRRNNRQLAATDQKIKMEVQEMLNPELALYPNPTKDCSWDCPVKDACVSLDDGVGDWEQLLNQELVQDVKKERHSWRKYLPDPADL